MNRRAVLFALILLAAAFPAMATDRAIAVVREIITMHQANVSDSVIYDYFASGVPFTLTADDLIDLADAGISDRLVRDLLSLSNQQQRVNPPVALAYDQSYRPHYGSYYPSWFYVGIGVDHHHYYPPFYHDHHYSVHDYYGHGYDGHGNHGYVYDHHGSSPIYDGGHSYLPHYYNALPLHHVADTIHHAVEHAVHDVSHAVGNSSGHNGRHSGGHGGGGHGGH